MDSLPRMEQPQCFTTLDGLMVAPLGVGEEVMKGASLAQMFDIESEFCRNSVCIFETGG